MRVLVGPKRQQTIHTCTVHITRMCQLFLEITIYLRTVKSSPDTYSILTFNLLSCNHAAQMHMILSFQNFKIHCIETSKVYIQFGYYFIYLDHKKLKYMSIYIYSNPIQMDATIYTF